MNRRRRRNQRFTHTGSFVATAITTALVAGCLLWFFGPAANEAHPIEVPEGASLRQIGHRLQADRVIHSAAAFELAGRLLGAERELRAGRFLIPARSAPHQIVQLLVSGPMMPNQVTLPEGLTLWEFAGILAAEAQVDSAAFVAAACDSQVAAGYGVRRPTLEGYLYPDTYDVPIGMPV
ncbi:MAG TPA: endolytic transglycosylase MltG, partial [Candidatus Udaeobacter sp.]|nr:endolytic transglycosylase MltG [Candidatus Udaeobacter sp.]